MKRRINMKKAVLGIMLTGLLLTGCNRQIIDTTWTFKYADIEGIGTVEIDSWRDYDESDMIQITAKNGTVYLTHSSNVVLRTK
jgi:uncharacterized lipoprotein NlpE involved in copper resistance